MSSFLNALSAGNTWTNTYGGYATPSLADQLAEARRQRDARWREALSAEERLLDTRNADEAASVQSAMDEALAAYGRWDRRVRDLEARFRR